MSDNLIPTAVVDKNGKQTTVRKRAAAPSAASKKLPAPALVTTPTSRPTTPLVLPETMTVKERDAYIAGSPLRDASMKEYGWDQMLKYQLDDETITLLKHMTESGRLSEEDARAILGNTSVSSESTSTYNAFLVIEEARKQNMLPSSTTYARAVIGTMTRSVIGLGRNDSSSNTKFTTQEQVTESAAVVSFIHRMEKNPDTMFQHVTEHRSSVSETAITNKHLDTLIREHPDRVDEIVDYVTERGLHKKNSGPVDDLRAYLNDSAHGAKAIAEGWL